MWIVKPPWGRIVGSYSEIAKFVEAVLTIESRGEPVPGPWCGASFLKAAVRAIPQR